MAGELNTPDIDMQLMGSYLVAAHELRLRTGSHITDDNVLTHACLCLARS